MTLAWPSVFTPLHAASTPAFTLKQEACIGKIAADYLLVHPEVLVQVSQKLQQQQHEREQLAISLKVMDNQAALFNEPQMIYFRYLLEPEFSISVFSSNS
ncbi:hypothetical protein QM201_25395 [Enterobacter asburiae]|nr:hypothetical protein [Enterobacter asburiae]